jgi:hypothetical protein
MAWAWLRFQTKHFLLFLAFLAPVLSYAQKYSVGLKVAPLVSWPTFGDKEDKKTFSRGITGGYLIRGIASFPMKKNFDCFVEGGYSVNGRKLSFNEDEWLNKSTYHFVDMAMLLRKSYKFRLKKNVPSFFFFNVGPEVNYWLSGNGKIIVNKPGYPYDIVFNKEHDGSFTTMYMNDVNRFLFGLNLGGGIKAPIKNKQYITVELRFTSGHTYLGKKTSSYIEILTFQDTMKTNLKSFSLNVAYTFDFDVQESRKGKSTMDKKIKRKR